MYIPMWLIIIIALIILATAGEADEANRENNRLREAEWDREGEPDEPFDSP